MASGEASSIKYEEIVSDDTPSEEEEDEEEAEDSNNFKIELVTEDDEPVENIPQKKPKKQGRRKKGHQYRSYRLETLKAAYQAVVKDGLPVYAAAKKYSVPQSTLRDRVLGRISAEVTTSGPPTIFSPEEEAAIASYVQLFSDIGHPLCRTKVRCLAGELANQLQRRDFGDGKILSLRWYYKLVEMFPEMQRNTFIRSGMREIDYGYYRKLHALFLEHNLENASKRLFNLDLVHVQKDDIQSKMVCCHSALSEKGSGTMEFVSDTDKSRMTFIGCSDVVGNKIPPCFVFSSNIKNPSQKSIRKIHNGAAVKYSATEKCTQDVLADYLKSHFTQSVTIGPEEKQTVIFYNSKSVTISFMLWMWAESNNISFFPMPMNKTKKSALKVHGCLHCLPQMFESEQKLFQDKIPGTKLTTIDVCKILNRLYSSLQVAHFEDFFQNAGLFPLPAKTPRMLHFDNTIKNEQVEVKKKRCPKKKKNGVNSKRPYKQKSKAKKRKMSSHKNLDSGKGLILSDWTGITGKDKHAQVGTKSKVSFDRRCDVPSAQNSLGLENGVSLEAYASVGSSSQDFVYIQGAEITNEETLVAEEVVIENIDFSAWS